MQCGRDPSSEYISTKCPRPLCPIHTHRCHNRSMGVVTGASREVRAEEAQKGQVRLARAEGAIEVERLRCAALERNLAEARAAAAVPGPLTALPEAESAQHPPPQNVLQSASPLPSPPLEQVCLSASQLIAPWTAREVVCL